MLFNMLCYINYNFYSKPKGAFRDRRCHDTCRLQNLQYDFRTAEVGNYESSVFYLNANFACFPYKTCNASLLNSTRNWIL